MISRQRSLPVDLRQFLMLLSIPTVTLVGNPDHWTECALLEEGIHLLPYVSTPTYCQKETLKLIYTGFFISQSSAPQDAPTLGLWEPAAQTAQFGVSASWNSFLFGCNQ